MNWNSLKGSQRGPWLCLFAAITIAGCSTKPQGTYVSREAVSELPAKHQEQLEEYMRRYFGTAAEPRFMIPDPEAEAPEDATGPEAVPLVERATRHELQFGLAVYTKQCAPCHGVTGDGNGEAAEYLDPKPRDYRQGTFKFTSTPRGEKPRDEDLRRIILRGAKGTSMPSFRWLPEDEMAAVIRHVKMLAQRGEFEESLIQESKIELTEEDDYDPKYVAEYATKIQDSWQEASGKVVRPVTNEPPYDQDSVALGQKAFLNSKLGCVKCHGPDGKGGRRPGVSAEDVPKDDWGQVAYAADLTSGMLHGGRRPLDIYRRIYSGINGTPMPGFATAFQEDPETMWHLVHFVTAVVEGYEVPEQAIKDYEQSLKETALESVSETPAETPADEPQPEPATPEPASPPEPATESPSSESPKPEAPAAEPSNDSEEKPADSPDAEKPSTEDKPAEEKPTEDKPADDKPAEDSPAEDKPAEETSAAESKSDGDSDAPADEPKSDEAKPAADTEPAESEAADAPNPDSPPADTPPAEESTTDSGESS
ncbi:MAG: c-type cytochrome [Planctomycetales bacterium]|nr:c-type cytochrome [Planctomycetales bacterium]